MPLKLSIQAIPNQEFMFLNGNNAFHVSLRTIQNLTFMSCDCNGEPLFANQLCTPNNFVNQYKFIKVGGKFYFECIDDEYPYYEKFDKTQSLFFYLEDEINA